MKISISNSENHVKIKCPNCKKRIRVSTTNKGPKSEKRRAQACPNCSRIINLFFKINNTDATKVA